MSVTVERVEAADSAHWDRVWEACAYSTFFHSRHWLEAWDRATGGHFANDTRAVTLSDGASAIVPLSKRKRALGLLASYESGPRGTYGGWISDHELSDAHARALAEYVTGLGNVAWYTNPFDPHAAVIHALAGRPDVTDAIVLGDDFDAVFRTWSKGHRAAVNQARRAGVTVRPAASVADWKDYYSAYVDSHRRWGPGASALMGWGLFEALSQLSSDLVRLWLAVIDDRVVAGALCVYARHHAVYWHGSAYADYFKQRPVNLLVHDAVRDACERGYRWFDFNPSGGHESVRSFKTSFGTREFACPTLRRSTPVARILDGLARK